MSLAPREGDRWVTVSGQWLRHDGSEWQPIANPLEPARHCASCGEPEGGPYAKPCCTDDNQIEG